MFTAAQIAAMDDREMALHASGSYGPKLRNDFLASMRKVAEKADAKESILALRPRMPPNELGQPQKPFAETFSVATAMRRDAQAARTDRQDFGGDVA